MSHQEFDRARELFPNALKEGKLVEYLGGFQGYGLVDPYADSPTDPSAAFEPIRHLIVEDIQLRNQVFAALHQLADNAQYGWMALYYISSLKVLEGWKKAELITPEFVASIAEGLRKNKGSLVSNRQWVGSMYENGLWGDVQRMNRILAEEDNLVLLPEEL